MPTPIGYMAFKKSSETIQVPVYAPADVGDDSLRIQTLTGVGAFDLIDATLSPLRIKTGTAIKGINLSTSIEEPTNLVDYSSGVPTNSSVVTTLYSDSVYTEIRTPNNGQGYTFSITSDLAVGQTYNATLRVEQTVAVDDRVTLHIRNVTQNKYIKTSVLTTDFLLNVVQDKTGTFSPTASNYTVGDEIQVQVVQSWRNSTHDNPFEFKIYNEGFSLS